MVDEARAFLAACVAERSPRSIAVLTALLLGMRASEICNATVRDLDDNATVLRIPDAKTAAGRRPLAVPPALRELLLGLCVDKLPTAPLFSIAGNFHRRRWVLDNTRRLCAVAGVRKVCAHSLRATAATIAKDAGMIGHAVSSSLGHASEAITARHYLAPGTSAAADQRAVWRVLDGGGA